MACVSIVVRFEPKAVWLDKFLFEAVIFGFHNSWFRGPEVNYSRAERPDEANRMFAICLCDRDNSCGFLLI